METLPDRELFLEDRVGDIESVIARRTPFGQQPNYDRGTSRAVNAKRLVLLGARTVAVARPSNQETMLNGTQPLEVTSEEVGSFK